MSSEAPKTLNQLAPGRFPAHLSLADLPVEATVSPLDKATTDFLIHVKHPYVSLELLQLMDHGCPTSGQDKGDTAFDLRMPRLAAQNPTNSDGTESVHARRRRIHETDSRIGPAFNELVADSLDRIIGALGVITYDQVWKIANQTTFVDMAQFPKYQLGQLEAQLQNEHYARYRISDLAKKFQRGRPLTKALGKLPNYQYKIGPISIPDILDIETSVFIESPYEADELRHFLHQLNPKEAANFAILSLVEKQNSDNSAVVVGPSDKMHTHHSRSKLVKVSLTDHNQVYINGEGLSLTVEPSRPVTTPEPVLGKVVGYDFPEEYVKRSIEGLVAWRTSPEGDRFLNRAEAFEAANRAGVDLPERADVIIGRIMASVGSRKVVLGWPPLLGLDEGHYEQTQRAVQSTILPKFKDVEKNWDFERDLFSIDNGLFQQLEANMEKLDR